MLQIQRLNMDSSWWIQWDEMKLILDPWLTGSEVEGFSWFSEQWHSTPPLPIADLEDYDAILVSQSYNDHLHKETLDQLQATPFICPPKPFKRLGKMYPSRANHQLPDLASGEWLTIKGLDMAYLDPGRVIDPVYYGIVLRKDQDVVVICPHGFYLTEEQTEHLKNYRVRLLITSFSLFKIPAFLGGAVNPGKENAMELIKTLNPDKIVHTHDENKHAKGLIKKISTTIFPDPEALEKELAGRFVYLGSEYETYQL